MTGRRLALITGAGRGIGAATAVALAKAGCDVVVNYVRDEAAAKAVADRISAAGTSPLLVRADVSVAAEVNRLFDAAWDRFGRIDVVVSNAGRPAPRIAPLAETTDAHFDEVFALNARGTFLVLREAARRICDGGRVVAVSTAGTVTSAAGNGIYTASKAVVENLVLALTKELGPRGVTVNSVLPGLTETDQLANFPDSLRAAMLTATPLGRFGTPQEVADVIVFLASHQARWITGQRVRATGGLV